MKNIWYKIKALKTNFRKLNAEQFKGITKNINQARRALNDVQTQMHLQYTDGMLSQEIK